MYVFWQFADAVPVGHVPVYSTYDVKCMFSGSLLMLYRLATCFFKPLRTKIMLGRNSRYGSSDVAFHVATKCDFGDWSVVLPNQLSGV